jgi:hypothetical protein
METRLTVFLDCARREMSSMSENLCCPIASLPDVGIFQYFVQFGGRKDPEKLELLPDLRMS